MVPRPLRANPNTVLELWDDAALDGMFGDQISGSRQLAYDDHVNMDPRWDRSKSILILMICKS